MNDYRIFMIDADGHFVRAIGFQRSDDKEAVEHAGQFVGTYDLELWHYERRVATFTKRNG